MFHNQNGIPDFATIYNLYLTAACSGIDHTFGDINRDPMYATDIQSLTLRQHVLTTNCGNAKKEFIINVWTFQQRYELISAYHVKEDNWKY